MRIVRIEDGEMKNFKHHIDFRKPKESRVYVVPESVSGCEEQVFDSSNIKKKFIRFRAKTLEIDSDNGKIRMWYAPYPKDFFSLRMRLEKRYISNLEDITKEIMHAFFDIPTYACRAGKLFDLSGKVTQRSVMGTESFVPRVSRLSEEIHELIGTEKDKDPSSVKSFDFWIFDNEFLDQRFAVTIGNENSKEFVRYHKLDGTIITAYLRPYFFKEYRM